LRAMQPNQDFHAQNADIPAAIFEWAADASTTTGAAQNIPASGLATSDTATVGHYSGRNTSVISRMRVRFVGHAGNVAGQTVNFAILVNGVAIATATLATPLATTAGVKTDVVNFTPTTLAEGDVVRCTLTPSAAGLSNALTNINVAVS
jgi:hypothetical protein